MQATKKNTLVPEKEQMQTNFSLPPFTDILSSASTKKNSFVPRKDQMQTEIPFPPPTDQVMQTLETCSGTTEKVKKVRGRNKCKEVASLEVGEKLKVTFYNNRTAGKNSSLFSRHLGIIVRDSNMCLLGVSSWDAIKEEKLNHMWAAIEDKFGH
ncbi:uncharacterized protein LOC142167405 [Nicotiana tabacum]|uniref:Uncharacterized protein LOC142167405 n=1 Tax=Nicotiana tabacum TaxID=4097 RepID=A0AC58SFD9_TOBAC